MLMRMLWIGLIALMYSFGCVKPRQGGDNPIVSPTNITNAVQSIDEPRLPPYTPWWAKEGK